MAVVLFIVDLLGQERSELGQLVQAGQAEPLQEVCGRAEQDRPGLLVGASLLDQAAQRERTHDAVAVDAAYRGHLRPADRLTVGHDGQGLQCRLSQPDLLAVSDELLHHRRILGPGVITPAARHFAQLETATFVRVPDRKFGTAPSATSCWATSSTCASMFSGTGSSATSRMASMAGCSPVDDVACSWQRLFTHRRVSSAPPGCRALCLQLRSPAAGSGAIQVMNSSPSGLSCSKETHLSRYRSRTARKRATIS